MPLKYTNVIIIHMDIDWLLRDMQNLWLIMSLGTPHELQLFIDRNSRDYLNGISK